MRRRADSLAACRPARVWTGADGRVVEISPEAEALLNWRAGARRVLWEFFAENSVVVRNAAAAAAYGDGVTLVVLLYPYGRIPILVEVAIAPTPSTDELCWTLTRQRPPDPPARR